MHSATPRRPRCHRALRTSLSLVLAAAGASLALTLTPTAAQAVDDYPYAGMGQCPLAPLPDSYLQAKAAHERRVARQPELVAAYEKALAEHQAKVAAAQAAAAAAAEQRQQDKDTKGPTRPAPAVPEVGPAPTPPAPVPPAPVRPERVCDKFVWYVNGSMGDPWSFALRHCTSFVTWRLRETNGVGDFHNYMGGGHFSNAENWDDNARDLGMLVDDVPAIGAVAQTDDGTYGHVAWVSAVGEGTVTIEEYNHAAPGVYSTRTVPVSDFRYVHVDDVAPAPMRGSDRSAAAIVDGSGAALSARVTDAGDLVVSGLAGGDTVVPLGRPGSFSPLAAPSLALDEQGRAHVAAVARDGRLVVGRVPDRREPWRPTTLGQGWARTSTPALHTVDDRLRVVAVSASGALRERRTTASGRWQPARTLRTSGPVSVHTAPVVAVDSEGVTWLATVSKAGDIEVRSADGERWSEPVVVGDGGWSVASTPALVAGSDGPLRLHAITETGDLVTHATEETEPANTESEDPGSGDVEPGEVAWEEGESLGGTWSPWSSPSVIHDAAGRTWLASVSQAGELVVRDTAPDSGTWRTPRTVGSVASTSSPALVATPEGDVALASAATRARSGWSTVARGRSEVWQGGPRRQG